MKTKKQPDGDFQCAVCTRFFPDRVSVITHLCWSDHENQLNDDLLLGIAELFYEEDKIMYAKMSSLMEARAETLKLELTECLVNMASKFKRGEM
ncbi:hypothetical protein Tco_0696612 [Tanacetum coccineum]